MAAILTAAFFPLPPVILSEITAFIWWHALCPSRTSSGRRGTTSAIETTPASLNTQQRDLSEEELILDILGYMLEHPDALYATEGIVAWWFSDDRRVMYSLNNERKDDVARFIGQNPE